MLTTDLVRVTRRGGELRVTPLLGKQRVRALELAELLLEAMRRQVGCARSALHDAWAELSVAARERKLADGLAKLIEDECVFEAPTELEPRQLRRAVFLAASDQRRRGAGLGREAVLGRVAEEMAVSKAELEAGLYADLKAAQRLTQAAACEPQALLERYDVAQLQAVLLKAVRVTAELRCEHQDQYRVLFRKLKFRRLLFTVEPLESGGYRLCIDGPFSLFESVTKYGLQLALVLPELLSVQRLALKAALLWGKQRRPVSFTLEQQCSRLDSAQGEALPDEVQRLMTAFAGLGSAWDVRVAEQVVTLPELGVCVPDLEFVHVQGQRVLLEVMGYWSRDAVWKRVEMVQRGLPERWLFAVSSRLRVSESVLEASESSALYVYKASMSARAVLERLETLRTHG